MRTDPDTGQPADHLDEAEPEAARLTADVVLFGEGPDGGLHVLLIKRGWAPFEGHWALPGGYIDPGEKPLAAAARELREETGVLISPAALDLVGVYADPGRDPRGRYATWAYTARISHLPQPTAGDDAADAKWMTVDELLNNPQRVAFDHADIVRDALRVAAKPESGR